MKVFLITIIMNLVGSGLAWAQLDRIHAESYLGEKRLDGYSERYQPLVLQDFYRGKMQFLDDSYFQNFFNDYIFQEGRVYSNFLNAELDAGGACSNESLSKHFDDIRYAYRLITLSYLLEGQWHLNMISKHLGFKKSCRFEVLSWTESCHPKSEDMKKFISRLKSFHPSYDEVLPKDYSKSDWARELKQKNYKWYSQYKVGSVCGDDCQERNLEHQFETICEDNAATMTLICSEQDQIYGLNAHPDAYYLLSRSNIVNTFNENDEARACLRRFSEVMGHREVNYDSLKQLFPPLQSFLVGQYQERFMQGRVFFFGAGKEFEDKGLTNFYVKEQPLVIEATAIPTVVAVTKKEDTQKKTVTTSPDIKVVVESEKKPVKVIARVPQKSAFLQASEVRRSSDLERVDVDMMKLKYDYVFSLNMINNLSQKLKSFMTREALKEMMDFDKLGTKEGPVPLLFIKFLIDMQEHQGLWNIISVLGEKFYVSNEIDSSFKSEPEYIQILNNESTGRQWQLVILRPQ